MKQCSAAAVISLCWIGIATLPASCQAQTLTTLASFAGTNGSTPVAGLVQASDGNLYGTTSVGGTSNDGTVFRITPGGTLTTLYSFTGADGENPQAGLIQASDGNLYGTTESGGTIILLGKPLTFIWGTVFRITPGGTETTLYSFTGGADGGSPQAGLIQASDGNLYGTTASGGAGPRGTVFSITPGGTLTTLYSFYGNSGPQGALIQASDGNFYGTTSGGGTSGGGTVFRITL